MLTRFTDGRDPKPRSREVFSFPRPETVLGWHNQSASLRRRLRGLPELYPAGLRACQVNAIEKLPSKLSLREGRRIDERQQPDGPHILPTFGMMPLDCIGF